MKDFGLNRDWLITHRGGAIKSHIDFVERLKGRIALGVDDVLVAERVAFSAAINQNARRAWEGGKRQKPSR